MAHKPFCSFCRVLAYLYKQIILRRASYHSSINKGVISHVHGFINNVLNRSNCKNDTKGTYYTNVLVCVCGGGGRWGVGGGGVEIHLYSQIFELKDQLRYRKVAFTLGFKLIHAKYGWCELKQMRLVHARQFQLRICAAARQNQQNDICAQRRLN